MVATFLLEGEGRANEGLTSSPGVLHQICAEFNSTLFNALLEGLTVVQGNAFPVSIPCWIVAFGVNERKQRTFVECCAHCREVL